MGEVGKINIDFYILETGEPRTISVFDNSDWLYSENLPSYLVINTPGSKKDRVFSFKKNAINTLNSHNLGLSCLKGDCTDENYVDLPDGIYTITLKSGYKDIEETKYYLKTDTIEIKLAEKVRSKGLDYNEKLFVESMLKVQWLISVAKMHTKLGDWQKADQFLTQAMDKLKTKCDGTDKC
jgi:hypothetical protein